MAGSIAPISSIGVPREVKPDEQRVALTPDAVRELVSHGLSVRVEQNAGAGAGIEDAAYLAAGAELVSREDAWGAHLVVKVKEPQVEEFPFSAPIRCSSPTCTSPPTPMSARCR